MRPPTPNARRPDLRERPRSRAEGHLAGATALLRDGAAQRELDSVLGELDERGFARLGRVLNDDGIERLRGRAFDLMLGRVRYEQTFFQMDAPNGRYDDVPRGGGYQGPSLQYRKLEKLEHDPLFFQWLTNPLFERVLRARIEGGISLYRAIAFNKGPAGGSEIPWHQDGGGLWGLSQMPELSIWTALDPAALESGCLEFLPGSHRAGLASPLGGLVPEPLVEQADAERRALAVPVEAGEAIVLDNRVWHRSGRTPAGTRRLAFSVCYMSERVHCLRKRRPRRAFRRVFEARAEDRAVDGQDGPPALARRAEHRAHEPRTSNNCAAYKMTHSG